MTTITRLVVAGAIGSLSALAFVDCHGDSVTAFDAAVDASTDTVQGSDATDAGYVAADGEGVTNCGDGSESCSTSLTVEGGTYFRTYTNDGGGATGLADPATVSDVRLDKYLVTVGRFRQFVGAWTSGWTPPAGSGKHTHLNGGNGLVNGGDAGSPYETGWDTSYNGNLAPTTVNLSCSNFATWTSSASSSEKRPINCVNWYESYAFCIWDGGFLPSEAEWEYAAAGGSEEREYPWGSVDPGGMSQYAIYGDESGHCYYPNGLATCTGVENVAPVGTATSGAGRWGQLDLAGNEYEWILDWFSFPGTYTACVDCADLAPSAERVNRGGFFYSTKPHILPTYLGWDDPKIRAHGIGFRCARTP